MFRFKELELYHWDFWKRPRIPLDEQIITIVGPNGSGKTTLLDALRTVLNAKQSHKRDIRKYLRHKNQRAAIKVIVDNQSPHSLIKRPFAPLCLRNEVTLAVVFETVSAKIIKKFYVLDGNVELEEIFNGKFTAFNPTEYSILLQEAGLSRAVLKVIALEQGATDELCEKSPRELLELVFDVFGDSSVLDKYRLSLNEENELRLEIKNEETEYFREEAQLQKDEEDIKRFIQFKDKLLELDNLETSILIQAKSADIMQNYYRLIKDRSEIKHDLSFLIEKRHQKETEEANCRDKYHQTVAEHRDILNHTHRSHSEKARLLDEKARLDLQFAQFHLLKKELAEIPEKRQKDLLEHAEEIHEEYKEYQSKERETYHELQELRNALMACERDEDSFYIDKIRDFQMRLEANGIQAVPLAKCIDIRDDQWQTAIESFLGRDRFALIVDKKDFVQAGILAEKERFKYYISCYETSDFDESVRPNSALSELELVNQKLPRWILNQLNHCRLIEKFSDYQRIDNFDVFISKDGYRKDSRGALSVYSSENYCGKRAMRLRKEALKKTIKETDKKYANLKALLEKISVKFFESQELIKIKKNLGTMELSLSNAESQLNGIQQSIVELNDRLHSLQESEKAIEAKSTLENNAHKSLLPDLERIREEERFLSQKLNEKNQRIENCIKDLDKLFTDRNTCNVFFDKQIPLELKLSKVEARIDQLREECEHFRQVNKMTEIHVEHYEKRKKQVAERLSKIDRSKQHLNDIHSRTQRARQEYIRVLQTSIQFYKENVFALAKIAGADVSVQMPEIENSLESINSAGLHISFAFDGKKPHSLDSGESSGGQKVIESLILLIALLKDSQQSQGGFVFIDEPFAHLDVLNVDRVGQFLESTGAQYIITTPNTQNIGVFRPAKLTIVTHKKSPSELFAMPPSFARKK